MVSMENVYVVAEFDETIRHLEDQVFHDAEQAREAAILVVNDVHSRACREKWANQIVGWDPTSPNPLVLRWGGKLFLQLSRLPLFELPRPKKKGCACEGTLTDEKARHRREYCIPA